ncbi:MAG: RAMP superfamily CRISPR-associated protein [Promethearchaeota archaeon]
MGWHLYLISFKLKSPLCIGFYKINRLLRTRLYVPARPFWGALTAKLTRSLKLYNYNCNYREIGEFLKKVMRFGYFYISTGKNIFIPKYTENGLMFDNLLQFKFENKFISSLISTSIEPHSHTAEKGMLHEIEYINPYTILNEDECPTPVFLKGLLWISNKANKKFTVKINKNIFFMSDNNIKVKFSDLIKTLQIGGERKYGFGLLKLIDFKEINDTELYNLGLNGIWEENEEGINIKLKKNEFIWAHTRYNSDLKIKGVIEPIVNRNWSTKGTGRELETLGLCWAPGSILMEDKVFKIIEDYGLWVG